MICDSAPSLTTLSFHRESHYDMNRTPKTYHEAHCGQCKNKEFEVAQPIKQDVNMLFTRSCPSTYNHTYLVLEVKQVTVSLGCTCVNSRHRKQTS